MSFKGLGSNSSVNRYKRTELPPRIAILYGGNMLATAFAGLIAAGITSRMEGVGGKKAWEWLFIIEGAMTVVIAILLLPLMTDYPLQSKHLFLSHDIQLLAVSFRILLCFPLLNNADIPLQEWRIRKENAGIVDEDPESIFWGLKQALTDPKLYMFIVMQMALITAQSFNNFFPSIVGTLGYDVSNSLLAYNTPIGEDAHSIIYRTRRHSSSQHLHTSLLSSSHLLFPFTRLINTNVVIILRPQ